MDKIWIESYPKGVPAEVDVRACPTLTRLLATSCQRFPDQTAFVNMGVGMSYRELDRLSRDFGAFLTHELRLRPGDRVAIMLPNA